MDASFDFDELTTVLSSERDVQSNLIEIARIMNEAVRAQHVERVHSCTLAYDTCAGRMEELEGRRIELCRRFARLRTVRFIRNHREPFSLGRCQFSDRLQRERKRLDRANHDLFVPR